MLLEFLLFDKKGTKKVLCKNGIKYARTFEILKALFVDTTMKTKQVQLWFKKGRENVNDYARPGRPSTSTAVISDNHRIAIREFVDDVCISFGSCQVIITDILDMKRVPVNIDSKLLNFDQTNVA